MRTPEEIKNSTIAYIQTLIEDLSRQDDEVEAKAFVSSIKQCITMAMTTKVITQDEGNALFSQFGEVRKKVAEQIGCD